MAIRPYTFALIGASRTGISLAHHLEKAGFLPAFLWNRSQSGIDRAMLHIGFQKNSIDLTDIPRGIDWIIIAVSDNAILTVAHQISQLYDDGAGIKVIHLSGAWDAGLLKDIKGKGFRTGSFHPLLSIPNVDTGIQEIGHAVFGCEGELAAELKKLAGNIGGKGVILNADQKALVHLSAVFVNNFQTVTIQTLKRLAESKGLSESALESLLTTLTRQAWEKAWQKSLEDSLTGPVVRRDLNTIDRHLKELEQIPEFKKLYEDYVVLTQKLLRE